MSNAEHAIENAVFAIEHGIDFHEWNKNKDINFMYISATPDEVWQMAQWVVYTCKYDGIYAADNVICPSETDTVEVILQPIGNVEELLSYDLGLGEETYHVCQGTEIELAASLDADDDGDPYPYHDRIGNAIPSYVRWYVSENNGEPCAAKIAASVESGILGYYMYKNGQQFEAGDGIVGCNIEDTINNVGLVGSIGMKETDTEIIDIMTK